MTQIDTENKNRKYQRRSECCYSREYDQEPDTGYQSASGTV